MARDHLLLLSQVEITCLSNFFFVRGKSGEKLFGSETKRCYTYRGSACLRLLALPVSHIGKNDVIASDVKAMMSIELTSKCLPMFSQRRLDFLKKLETLVNIFE